MEDNSRSIIVSRPAGKWPTSREESTQCSAVRWGSILALCLVCLYCSSFIPPLSTFQAAAAVREYGERYLLLGPLTAAHAHEVEPRELPDCTALGRTIAACRARGWRVVAGRWLVEGSPTVLLLDTQSAAHKLDEWKHELYQLTQIGIPHSDAECNPLVTLGFMLAQVVAELRHQLSRPGECEDRDCAACQPQPGPALLVAHFHEWMVGVGLILLRLWKAGSGQCRGLIVSDGITYSFTIYSRG